MSFGVDRDAPRRALFARRTVLLGAAGAAAYAGLGARLYTLQIQDQAQYATLSDDNRFFHQPVAPPRGLILDRYGAVIAGADPNYEIYVTPDQITDPDAVAGAVLRLLDPAGRVESRRRERLADMIRRAERYKPLLIAQGVDWDAFARVNFHRPDLPGVDAVAGETRAYGLETREGTRRDAEAFAHVVGYVQRPPRAVIDTRLEEARDRAERRQLNRVMRHPSYRIGRTGLELTQDARLQGRWGEKRVEVDARGRVVREVGLDQQTLAGEDIRLTLDAEVQAFAHRRLYGESGAAVALDVRTGAILCMVSTPAFDPNLFVPGMHPRAYRALNYDERAPLYNKPLRGLYAPGSTFKMIVALAALRAGVITPEEKISCSGRMPLGDRVFHCWKREGHGPMNLHDALVQSCDTYFYEVALRLYRDSGVDGEPLAEEARRWGLADDPYPLATPGSRAGLMPTDRWKRTRYGSRMTLGDRLNVAIGQGYALASPLELAVMMARMAPGGRAVKPYLLQEEAPQTPPPPLTDVDAEALAAMHRAMAGVVNESRGTAYWALDTRGVDLPGVQMAGKTGTSQVRRISAAERAAGVIANEDLPWRRRDHGLFVGYAPADQARYAVAVVVAHGGSGSKAAAPPARDILKRLLEREAGRDVAAPAGDGTGRFG